MTVDPKTPPLASAVAVVEALQALGATAAVGGSGLLAALGLVERVRDWDVTTDVDRATVEAALRSTRLPFAPAVVGDGVHATRGRYLVSGDDVEVDVLVGFALRDGREVVQLPTRVTRIWRGLPMADPSVWLRAYRLLGRHDRADLLQEWLYRGGAARTS